jgi:hypothetical protein
LKKSFGQITLRSNDFFPFFWVKILFGEKLFRSNDLFGKMIVGRKNGDAVK